MKHMTLLALTVATVTLSGCGGDGSSNGPVADSYVLPAGKATIAFSAISTARLDSSISGIDMSIVLPQGMSVATTSSGSRQIDPSKLVPGVALSGTNLAYGSYSAPILKAKLTMATTSNSFRSGEFLRLICDVAPNTSITAGTLRALNNPVPVSKAAGYDPATSSTTVLTSKVKVTMDIVP